MNLDKPSLTERPHISSPSLKKKTTQFIELTGRYRGKVFIKASAINGVLDKDGYRKIFVNNDSFPYEVQENAEYIINLINGVLNA